MTAVRLEDRDLLQEISSQFLAECGPLLTGDKLSKALGYQTDAEFASAQISGTLPVRVFPIDGRIGVFAYSWDVACWLASLGSRQD